MQAQCLRSTLLVACLCLLSACGFQLRGSGNNATLLPDSWKSMALVTGNPNSEFSREILAHFAANGVEWSDRQNARFSLTLGPERFTQRNLTLNSEARAAEFELTMSANFAVKDALGNDVIAQSTASVVKQMENDPRNVVGKGEEIRLLQQEMRAELSQQIMRRIIFYSTSAEAVADYPGS
ncbi:MAG: hypothetical protein KDI09_11090 [Halioglobus sp.]|nr:hypothetical protein [Halioglobus sp.]